MHRLKNATTNTTTVTSEFVIKQQPSTYKHTQIVIWRVYNKMQFSNMQQI